MITKDQALEAKKKFVKEHWKYPPINAVGITWDENKNYAVRVNCVDHIPDGLPQEIDGVKVMYQIVGEIRLH